jgi:ribosome biogenesis GTPase A
MRENENLMASDENIVAVREQLSEIIEDDKIAEILGRECVKHLKEFRALVDKRCEEPFTLVILGDFKRGKSTIINALLGKKLAPINVTPETYTINEISFGHTQTVEAILENGQRVPLVLEDITRENLEKRMKLFPAKISCVQIKDNAPILKSMRIVDTPGLPTWRALTSRCRTISSMLMLLCTRQAVCCPFQSQSSCFWQHTYRHRDSVCCMCW